MRPCPRRPCPAPSLIRSCVALAIQNFQHNRSETRRSLERAYSQNDALWNRGGAATSRHRLGQVRFASQSGQIADISGCPLCANRVLTHRSEKGNPGQSAKGGGRGRRGPPEVFRLCVTWL